MRVVTRPYNDEIHIRIVKHFISARNRKAESKSLTNIMRRDPRRGSNRTKLHAFGLEVWQQHRRHVTTSANHSQHDRLLRLPYRRAERNLTDDFGFRIVVEHNP